MRITIVAGGFADLGGIEHFISDIVDAILADGMKCDIVCWNAGPLSGNTLLRQLGERGARIHCSPVRWGCRLGLPDRALISRARESAERSEVIIFAKLLSRQFHQALLSDLPRRPKQVLVTPYRPAELWTSDRVPIDALNQLDLILVQSQVFAEDLERLGYVGRVLTIPYIPPAESCSAPLPSFSCVQVGFLGRLEAQKNVECLLRATQRVTLTRPVRLQVMGQGSQGPHLRRLTNDMGLAGQVIFRGMVPRESLAGAIDSCHTFVFSSRTEGQCLAALEILARGRPIVATPVGAFPSFLNDPDLGRISESDGPEELASLILEVIESQENGGITVEGTRRRYVAKFNHAAVVNQYVSLLRSLVA